MNNHIISSRGTLDQAMLANIKQTWKILFEEVSGPHPDMTVDAKMYVRDVSFLLNKYVIQEGKDDV